MYMDMQSCRLTAQEPTPAVNTYRLDKVARCVKKTIVPILSTVARVAGQPPAVN